MAESHDGKIVQLSKYQNPQTVDRARIRSNRAIFDRWAERWWPDESETPEFRKRFGVANEDPSEISGLTSGKHPQGG